MDIKKFQCTYPSCSKSFNRRDYLVRHAANHMDVLPFKCLLCPQRFARADLLEKHLRTKSHEKRQKRELCKLDPERAYLKSVKSQQPPDIPSQTPSNHRRARKMGRVNSTSSTSSSSSSSSLGGSTTLKSEVSPFSSVSDSSASSISEFPINGSNGSIDPLGKIDHIIQQQQPMGSMPISSATYLTQPESYPPLTTTSISVPTIPAHSKHHHYHHPQVPPDLFQPLPTTAFQPIMDPNQPAQIQHLPYGGSAASTPAFSFFSDFPDHSQSNNSYAWLFGPDFQADNLYSGSFGDPATASHNNIPSTTVGGNLLVATTQGNINMDAGSDNIPINSYDYNLSGTNGSYQPPNSVLNGVNDMGVPPSSSSSLSSYNVQYSLYSGTNVVTPAPAQPTPNVFNSPANPNLTNDRLNGLTPLTASILDQTYGITRVPTPAWIPVTTPREIRTRPSTPMIRHKRVRVDDNDADSDKKRLGGVDDEEESYSMSHPISMMILDAQISPVNDILFDASNHMSDNNDGSSNNKGGDDNNNGNDRKNSSGTTAIDYDERERRKHAESSDFSLATLEQSPQTLVSSTTRLRFLKALRYVPSVTAESAYFTKEALSRYLADFWRLFIPLYPIIHRATFRASHVRSELLIMMVSIGMTYHPDNECYQLSLNIQRHRRFHGAVMALVNDGDDQNNDDVLPLWVLQCLILRNYFAKMLGSKAQFENCQVFHGSNIALMRLSGYFEGVKFPVWPTKPPADGEGNEFELGPDYDRDFLRVTNRRAKKLAKFNACEFSDDYDSDMEDDEDAAVTAAVKQADKPSKKLSWWQEWVHYESCKRVSYLAFICDTQHASLFRHSQVMSVFDMNLELPCTDACWYAESPRVLWHLYNQQPSAPERNFTAPWETVAVVSEPTDSLNQSTIPPSSNTDKTTTTTIETMGKYVESPQGRTETTWPSFLHGVKTLLSSYQHFKPGELSYSMDTQSQFSRSVLLYALISIGCDLKGRSHLDMGLIAKNKIDESKTRLVVGFMVWKGFYDRHLRLVRDRDYGAGSSGDASQNHVSLNEVISNQGPFGPENDKNEKYEGSIEFNDYSNANLLCANWAMHHVGLILMFSHASMLRMFSGASSWFPGSGKPHTRELLASQLAMNNWAASEDAKWAVWFSTQFLRRIFENQNLIYKADHVPWCVFLATLTIWCYEVCRQPELEGENIAPADRSDIFNPKRYFSNKIDNTGGYDHSEVKVDTVLARRDAFAYLRMVESTPPQLAGSVFVANNSSAEAKKATPNKTSTHTWYDQGKASIGLVAFSYSIVQRSPRGLSGFICDKLLEAVSKFN